VELAASKSQNQSPRYVFFALAVTSQNLAAPLLRDNHTFKPGQQKTNDYAPGARQRR
jgi:hypothetical protein